MSTAFDYVTISARDRTARRSAKKQKPAPAPAPPPSTTQRTLRRWGSIALLMIGAGIVIAYISNAIAVNRLLGEVTQSERQRDSIRTVNEHLRAEVLRLMAPERITTIATTQLGMTQQRTPPKELK